MLLKLKIDGMTCGHCKMKVETTLQELANISTAEVDLIEGVAEIEIDKDIDEDELKSIIADAGYSLVSIEY